MDESLAKLLLSDQVQSVSPDALRVYLLLRAEVCSPVSDRTRQWKLDGLLVSSLTAEALAERLDYPVLTVQRYLNGELLRSGWVNAHRDGASRFYQLGVLKDGERIWYVEGSESPKEMAHGEAVRLSVARDVRSRELREAETQAAERLHERERRRLATDAGAQKREVKASTRVLREIFGLHKEQFGKDDPSCEAHSRGFGKKAYTYANRVLKHGGEGVEDVLTLIVWTFENWTAIKAAMPWWEPEGPQLNLFASKAFFQLDKFRKTGIPKAPPKTDATPMKRFEKSTDEDKEVFGGGW